MEYFNRVLLKDGTACVLRNPTAGDARSVLDILKTTSGETNNMLRYPDEIQLSIEEEREFLEIMSGNPKAMMIAALVNEKIVATASLAPVAECEKCAHRASFGIVVLKNYWGCGIGTLMTTALMESAPLMGYRQIELEVLAENRRALALYRKFGFTTYGTNKQAFYHRGGTYSASRLMVLTL